MEYCTALRAIEAGYIQAQKSPHTAGIFVPVISIYYRK
jgi:hypothetical protein